MKNLIIILILLAVISPVFAQQNSGDEVKDMYYINVPVERVYPSSTGFIVQYRKLSGGIGNIGIPNEWFSDAGGRAEILNLPAGTNWPTMSIFYEEGQFKHVRLYVHRARSHKTWGNIPQGIDVSRFFPDSETLKIDY